MAGATQKSISLSESSHKRRLKMVEKKSKNGGESKKKDDGGKKKDDSITAIRTKTCTAVKRIVSTEEVRVIKRVKKNGTDTPKLPEGVKPKTTVKKKEGGGGAKKPNTPQKKAIVTKKAEAAGPVNANKGVSFKFHSSFNF